MRAELAACVAVVLALSAGPVGRARAYLDGSRFTAPAIEGGAGGRFFTGAPEDGYSCAVCHRGGGSAPIALEGVPELWDPGATYELSLTLPATVRSAGANLEIAGTEGSAAGTLVAVPEGQLDEADRCRDGRPATSAVALEGRLVARVEPCGARRARVLWTAPSMPRTDVRFFASAVAANDSGDPEGDGASSLVVPLRARGAPDPSGATIAQRCSITRGALGAPAPWAALAVFFMLVRLGRRRSRRGDRR